MLFFLGSILTKNDSLAWRGSWIRILGQRNSLTKRHSFLERERAGRFDFTRDKEDIGRRNLDDVAGFDPDVFAEPASQQPVQIGFFHVVDGLSIVWAGLCFMNDESRRSVCRIEPSGNAEQLEQSGPALDVVNAGQAHGALDEIAAVHVSEDHGNLRVDQVAFL